jgi:hypothetical protein
MQSPKPPIRAQETPEDAKQKDGCGCCVIMWGVRGHTTRKRLYIYFHLCILHSAGWRIWDGHSSPGGDWYCIASFTNCLFFVLTTTTFSFHFTVVFAS